MSTNKDISRLNMSSITTSDPSNHSVLQKKLKKHKSSTKLQKNTPMNTPRTSSSTSLAKELTLIPGISLPSNLSPLRINEITNFRSKKIKEYQQVLETCLSESLPVTNS